MIVFPDVICRNYNNKEFVSFKHFFDLINKKNIKVFIYLFFAEVQWFFFIVQISWLEEIGIKIGIQLEKYMLVLSNLLKISHDVNACLVLLFISFARRHFLSAALF